MSQTVQPFISVLALLCFSLAMRLRCRIARQQQRSPTRAGIYIGTTAVNRLLHILVSTPLQCCTTTTNCTKCRIIVYGNWTLRCAHRWPALTYCHVKRLTDPGLEWGAMATSTSHVMDPLTLIPCQLPSSRWASPAASYCIQWCKGPQNW